MKVQSSPTKHLIAKGNMAMQRTDLLLAEADVLWMPFFRCQTALIFQMMHMSNFMCLKIAPSNGNFLTNHIIRVSMIDLQRM